MASLMVLFEVTVALVAEKLKGRCILAIKELMGSTGRLL